MIRTLAIVVLAFFLVPASQGQKVACPESGIKAADGSYSKLSVRLCWQNERKNERHLKIASPDGSVLLEVSADEGQLFKDKSAIGNHFAVAPDVEWLWSPDSQGMIITSLIGNPTPVITAVSFVDDTLTAPELMKKVQVDFAARHPELPCAQDPNVAGLTWTKDSKEVVLVAEIPASPRCEKADGYFEAYVISIPRGQIIERYSMRETVTKFRKVLGSGLLEDVKAQRKEQTEK